MKNILMIAPYSGIYPPKNGGMKRCFHLIHQLSKHSNLTLISFLNNSAWEKAIHNYPELSSVMFCNCPPIESKSKITRIKSALNYRWIKKNIQGPTDSSFLRYYPELKKLLKTYAFDIVILENLATLNAVPIIRKNQPKAKIIYDAHNFDTHLEKKALEKGQSSQKMLSIIEKAESTLYKKVDAIMACSKQDVELFSHANQFKIPCFEIPNGIEIGETYNDGIENNETLNILFCGSLDYEPNREGIIWFVENCWNNLTQQYINLKLSIIGSGSTDYYKTFLKNYKNINLIGEVDDVNPYYNNATLCIVPLLTGSGTRLKILEAMSKGVPVVSTSKGAEGITYTNEDNIIIADTPVSIEKKIQALIDDILKRKKIAGNARILVEQKYDWKILGKKLAEIENF